jgi:Flp pilus assembly protein TadD
MAFVERRLQQALELDPQQSWAYNNRGLIYDERGDFEHAIEDYDRAIKYGSTLAVENP